MQLANNIQTTRTATAAATGELSLGEIAAFEREAAQPGFAENLAAMQEAWDAAPTDIRPEWDTEPTRWALQLQMLKERSAAADAAWDAEMDALGIKL